jgi:hypothetical protein
MATRREAPEVLGTFQVDVVLAVEDLPDGRGYDVALTSADGRTERKN